MAGILVLGAVTYSAGLATGFVSDDYNWLHQAVQGTLGWDSSFRLSHHTNSLPLEIALYHLKFTLFGFNPVGYHLFALAGHLLNVVMVFQLAGRLGLARPVAYLAAVIAGVLAAGAQAVYWMSGDPHVWATLGALAAVILYIDYRERGDWWRYLAAVALAVLAPLVKAEGVAVIGGVLAYELFWRHPIKLTWKTAPFALAPLPFVVWELTTSDQLQTQRELGFNIVLTGLGYLRQLLVPIDPAHFFSTTGGRVHPSLVLVGIALYVVAAALGTLVIAALTRRETFGLLLFAVVGTAPALLVTLGTQSRYIYFAGLVMSIAAAIGGWRLYELLRDRIGGRLRLATLAVALSALATAQIAMTVQESSDLRAAHNEAQAFVTAVLADHQSVPPGTRICLLNSPLDAGSATGVFADPRLGPDVGIPAVSDCGSAPIPAGVWAYQREPQGTYKQVQ